eukprot:1900300-Ditylum_brightwellii.AAC.1
MTVSSWRTGLCHQERIEDEQNNSGLNCSFTHHRSTTERVRRRCWSTSKQVVQLSIRDRL